MTVTQKKHAPSLRFPGFAGEWCNTTIGQNFEFKNGLNKEKEFFGHGTPIINFMDVYHLTAIRKKHIDGFVELSDKEIANFSVRKGDVFFTRTSETINDIGMSATLVEDIENCVFSGFVLRARPINKKLDNLYKSYCFSIKPVRKEIVTKSSYTTRALTSGRLLNKACFYYPSDLQEQHKIASFLASVDTKIEQLGKKKELLELYKQGMIQKLFSQEIRFKDEQGKDYPDWEQSKLGNIGTTFNGLTGKNSTHFGKGKPYIQYLQVFQKSRIDVDGFGFVEIGENESQNKVCSGDVFFTTSSETPNEVGTASVLIDEVENTYLNSFCFGYRVNREYLLPEYARFSFRANGFRKRVVRLAQGSTRYNLSKSSLMKIETNLPLLQEQQKIADFLSSIDKKIELVAEQLEQARTFKKGLLQQIFI